jgi:hypothetical protein
MLTLSDCRTEQVVGKTEVRGAQSVNTSYSPQNVFAKLCHHLGIDPDPSTYNHSSGRSLHLLDDKNRIAELAWRPKVRDVVWTLVHTKALSSPQPEPLSRRVPLFFKNSCDRPRLGFKNAAPLFGSRRPAGTAVHWICTHTVFKLILSI